MKIELEPAYILHSRPYRETSLLLEALTRDRGRAGLVARGARGQRSRWKNILQPFRPLLLSWSQRGELGTLTGADQVASPPAMRGEPLFCGLYVNELLMRLLQRADPHPEVFESYRLVMNGLAAGADPQPLLRIFERELLQATGFGMQLEYEYGSDEAIQEDAWYVYHPENGPIRQPLDKGDRQDLVSGAALIALKSGQLGSQYLPELKRLMRRLISRQLGGRPLASQSLFSQVP
jgi:DNA repair protein RecO (recombination protein O)